MKDKGVFCLILSLVWLLLGIVGIDVNIDVNNQIVISSIFVAASIVISSIK